MIAANPYSDNQIRAAYAVLEGKSKIFPPEFAAQVLGESNLPLPQDNPQYSAEMVGGWMAQPTGHRSDRFRRRVVATIESSEF